MKFAALLLLLFSLAVAPLATATVPAAPADGDCASACCETDPSCCATACPCPPLSCHIPALPSLILPAGQPIAVFAPGSSHGAHLTDDTCSVRTERPPVPPPRA